MKDPGRAGGGGEGSTGGRGRDDGWMDGGGREMRRRRWLIKEAGALLLLPSSSSLCRGWGWNGTERNGDGRNTEPSFGFAFFKKGPYLYGHRSERVSGREDSRPSLADAEARNRHISIEHHGREAPSANGSPGSGWR